MPLEFLKKRGEQRFSPRIAIQKLREAASNLRRNIVERS
jgi:hypothetical protein